MSLSLFAVVRVLSSDVCGIIIAVSGGRLCVETPDGRWSWHYRNELAKTVARDATHEEYEPGVPGRACLACNSAWPATEPDDAHWHHASDCEVSS